VFLLVVLGRSTNGRHQGVDDAGDCETTEVGIRDLEEGSGGLGDSADDDWRLMMLDGCRVFI
jgi:hypothetical protein